MAPVYVLAAGPTPDAGDVLMTFDPSTGTFSKQAAIPCVGMNRLLTPLAVDRAGLAYVVEKSDLNRQMFRVNLAEGTCELTPLTMWTTAMAFAGDGSGDGETLFVADTSGEMFSVDTSTFAPRDIGHVSPNFLTGTHAGDLFSAGFTSTLRACPGDDGGRSTKATRYACYPDASTPLLPVVIIDRVDPTTSSQTPTWTASAPSGFGEGAIVGFVAWGGDFYLFEAPAADIEPPVPNIGKGAGVPGAAVWRFRPSDLSIVQVAQTDATVLGVAVSTCSL